MHSFRIHWLIIYLFIEVIIHVDECINLIYDIKHHQREIQHLGYQAYMGTAYNWNIYFSSWTQLWLLINDSLCLMLLSLTLKIFFGLFADQQFARVIAPYALFLFSSDLYEFQVPKLPLIKFFLSFKQEFLLTFVPETDPCDLSSDLYSLKIPASYECNVWNIVLCINIS